MDPEHANKKQKVEQEVAVDAEKIPEITKPSDVPISDSQEVAGNTENVPETTDSPDATLSESSVEALIAYDRPNNVPLSKLPLELFDEILAYFPILPANFNEFTIFEDYPPLKYSERTETLRSLSQSCRALRQLAFPRLWDRLDTCFVPEHKRNEWYMYITGSLRRKTEGVLASGPAIQHCIRTLTFGLTEYDLSRTLNALTELLKALPNLEIIHVTCASTARYFANAVSGLTLPSVRTLRITSDADTLIPVCPNVTHVQMLGAAGKPAIESFKDRSIEILIGGIKWENPSLVDRLVENAPGIKKLEMRAPIHWKSKLEATCSVPAEWAEIIPKLSALPNLVCLILTFPGMDVHETDLAAVAAARKMLRNSQVKGNRRLIIRRVVSPHYSNQYEEEVVRSYAEVVFN